MSKHLVAVINTFHDCAHRDCTIESRKILWQERHKDSSLHEWTLCHKDEQDYYIMNLAQMRSADLLSCYIGPHPFLALGSRESAAIGLKAHVQEMNAARWRKAQSNKKNLVSNNVCQYLIAQLLRLNWFLPANEPTTPTASMWIIILAFTVCGCSMWWCNENMTRLNSPYRSGLGPAVSAIIGPLAASLVCP